MSRPIRILELRSVWGTGGGPDKTILTGTPLFDGSRFAITVCYIRDARDQVFALDKRAAALGLDYVEVIERTSFDRRIWPALRALVRSRGIDIVHGHDQKTDALTWALSLRDGIVPMSTAHGFAGESRTERIYYAIEKRLLARFPHVIAVSQPLKAELIRTGSKASRITVINNAIDDRAFLRTPGKREEIRRSLGLTPEDIVIGAVGRLEAEKRFDLLFEAVAEVRKRHPGVVLLIAGEGSLRSSLEGVIRRLGLEIAVRLLGHRTDVIDLHHAFDLFVQSSEREGTPNCVLEAMALETPVVATDVGGTGELVTDGTHGLLVARNDVGAMRDALLGVIGDPAAAAQRVAAARRRVETELSFKQRVKKVEAIYEALVTARAAAQGQRTPR